MDVLGRMWHGRRSPPRTGAVPDGRGNAAGVERRASRRVACACISWTLPWCRVWRASTCSPPPACCMAVCRAPPAAETAAPLAPPPLAHAPLLPGATALVCSSLVGSIRLLAASDGRCLHCRPSGTRRPALAPHRQSGPCSPASSVLLDCHNILQHARSAATRARHGVRRRSAPEPLLCRPQRQHAPVHSHPALVQLLAGAPARSNGPDAALDGHHGPAEPDSPECGATPHADTPDTRPESIGKWRRRRQCAHRPWQRCARRGRCRRRTATQGGADGLHTQALQVRLPSPAQRHAPTDTAQHARGPEHPAPDLVVEHQRKLCHVPLQ